MTNCKMNLTCISILEVVYKTRDNKYKLVPNLYMYDIRKQFSVSSVDKF